MDVCEEWLKKRHGIWSEGHIKKQSYRIRRHIYPHLGSQIIAKMTPPDVLKLLRLLENDFKVETAHRLLNICSQVFRYAIACGVCTYNPCQDLKGALSARVNLPRPALLEQDKIGLFMQQAKHYPTLLLRNAMLFSAYTFGCPSEIRQAEWSEIDFEKKEWLIPVEKMKMRRPHCVPLSSQCIEILNNMKGLDKKYVFPSPRAGRPLSDAGVLSAIRSMGYSKEEMCAHGFRAMASTLLNEMAFRPDVIEKALAHGDGDKVRSVYNRAEYLTERREMMQKYANFLDELANNAQISILLKKTG